MCRQILVFLLLVFTNACVTEDDCVAVQADDCSPLYTPSFANVYAETLKPTCGQSGTACHSTDGAQGGFVISDLESTHAALIDDGRVVANDAACSPLVVRLETSDSNQVMPPGGALSFEERCAIETWINSGAVR